MKAATGTREWATHSVNCIAGCAHRCLYCYANAMAARFDRVHPEGWGHEVVNTAAVHRRYGLRKGTIMFPTTHDITPENLADTGETLQRLLSAGNRVLVVSKPHLACIEALTTWMVDYRSQILFRFTIGAASDEILSFWEPGAPAFGERLDSLRLAHARGYRTSVSMEPLLEPEERFVVGIVETLAPFVTEDIWIGKLNKGEARLRANGEWRAETAAKLRKLEASQSDKRIRLLFDCLRGHPLVKWKESIKAVVGIDARGEADDGWAR